MRTPTLAFLALAAAVFLTQPAPAQEKFGFLLVNATVTDFEKLGVYGRALPPIYAKYDGTYVVSGGVGRNIEVLDGTPSFQSVIFAQFDSLEDVEAFWWSEDYRAVVPLRDGAGRFDVVGLEGTGNAPYEAKDGIQPAYQFSLTTVKDPTQVPAYYAAMSELFEDSSARLIAFARPDDLSVLEGPTPNYAIEISSWPSLAALKAFVADPRYKAAAAARAAAVDTLMLGAEAIAPAD